MGNSGTWLALLASVGFGLTYVATAPLVKALPLNIFYLVTSVIALVVYGGMTVYRGNWSSLGALKTPEILAWLAVIVVAAWVGNMASALAIRNSNPLLVGVLELSYPLFIAGFSWYLLGSSFVTKGNIAGGLLILSGVIVMMVWK